MFSEYNAGNIQVPKGLSPGTVIGQNIDARARIRLVDFLQRQGINEGPGARILVNRRLVDPAGSGRYRIPDVNLPNSALILDGTIGKSFMSPQVQEMLRYSGGELRLVYPTVPLPKP